MTDLLAPLAEPTELTTRFERALYWLGEAVRVDEVMQIRDQGEQLRLLGKQAKDKDLQAKAVELSMRSERRLGELLIEVKAAGQLSRGGRPKTGAAPEPVGGQIKLEELGIDKKLSAKAQALAGSPLPIFEDVVRQAREKILAGKAIVINPIKDVTARQKQLKRRARELQLAAKGLTLPKDTFQVIYADPEWKFDTYSEGGLDRTADNHYPTSDLDTIKRRPVGTIAAADCVLFLWATAPMQPQALEVMRYWGFEYKTQFCWDKVEPGTGYWNRNQHELLLVGTRGKVPAPAPGTQWPSLIRSRKGAHSEKPDWAYELIEAYFPNLKKIELNARRRRDGWSAWGFEAPEEAAPAVAAPAATPPAEAISRGGYPSSTQMGEAVVAMPQGAASTVTEIVGEAAPVSPTGEGRCSGSPQAHLPETADDLPMAAGETIPSDQPDARAEALPEISGKPEPTFSDAPRDAAVAGEARQTVSPASHSERAGATGAVGAGEGFSGSLPLPESSEMAVVSHDGSRLAGPACEQSDVDRDVEAQEQLELPAAAYAAALAAGPGRGRYSRALAAPVLSAGVAAELTHAELAADLGHPIGTVQTWLYRCGLTGLGTGARAPRKAATAEATS